MKITNDEIIETILAREIRKEIDNELIHGLKDISYIPKLSPMIFENQNDKENFETGFEKVVNRIIPGDPDWVE